MKYGHFDKENKEYVITRPDTPLPWINYLGCEEYCGLMSNTAGGYSFYKDPKERRLLRYRYNNVPMDRGGRYLYLRDNQSKDFWSASWQPVLKDFDSYKYECRHGTGYTVISSEYAKIKTKTTYFVPKGENLEIWKLEATNSDTETRDLSAFSFVEFCLWDALNDMTDYQYNLNIGQTEYKDNTIYHLSRYRVNKDICAYFGCSNVKAAGFDTQRRDFMGNYGDWSNPRAVIEGKMNSSIAHGWSPVGSQMFNLKLKPGETKTLIFILGFVENPANVSSKVNKFKDVKVVDQALADLKQYWDDSLNKFSVQSEDPELDIMVNLWNQYQCRTTFNWSRSASYYESGIGRGMGFRDSNQDTLGFVHLIPEKVKERIVDLASNQFEDGSAYHQYSPLTKKGNGSGYSDDHLWLCVSVPAYVKETGDIRFLETNVPFVAGEKGTIYEHMARAINFSITHVGPHGLPKSYFADWNDCLNLSHNNEDAESVMVAQMVVYGAHEMIKMAELIGKKNDVKKFTDIADEMKKKINKVAWDGNWYLRAFDEQKLPMGSSKNKEGQIYLETQAWGVMSGTAEPEQALKCMDAVNKQLATEHGVMLMTPPYKEFIWKYGSICVYPPGLKENGAIFCHPNPWAMIAECMIGRGDIAYQYYKAIQPAARNEIADIHKTEPYVYCQMIAGRDHPDFGEGKNSWLTGSACWNLVAAMQWILGIRPDYNGLIIDPCIPKAWKGFEVKKVFRGATYYITVRNPQNVSKGVKSVTLDNKRLESNLIPPDKTTQGKEHHVEVIMG
ncbi:glycosyl transferase [candidate division WOR-1 bacterium RIFOXYB2_FULL_42_35]|uniref:Glycosyl transferase n=1 Tax=candidate division WOR-1 bacterium RIFOXYC2_FULL_41_25 TaxID=1802586 RepID=A0A1F4TMZ4_UNCSA|nr:MAG: glycosyl transferase [candidate division WOR-1 bacterium RIFOXYA2_FULL_41_14]OGC24247.1 MAG: glycosyl transferase [candidate division WOR-1 bacterium RIFOXYB2_FULL_42_35]OGC33890.1 MAG: glycosyl transferase [candidate division WOR-1 bacterium RIFOXYC2_FULL_41_25]